jgi:pyruvate dehydrogenase E1 component
MAVIIQDGLRRMVENQEDVFYYITGMNENYHHPAMPVGAEEGILKGLYLFKESAHDSQLRVQLIGAGTILLQVIQAAELLEKEFNVAADIWGATSFNELRKDIESTTRYNRLHPHAEPRRSHVEMCLSGRKGPVIAATDYMKLVANQISEAVSASYVVLGTDGFGRSDTRAALRDFFEVDARMIAYSALKALYDQGELPLSTLDQEIKQLNIATDRVDPILC